MGAWTVLHWSIIAAVVVLFVAPIGLILKRLGYSPFLVLLLFIPAAPIVGLWFLALARWPAFEGREAET